MSFRRGWHWSSVYPNQSEPSDTSRTSLKQWLDGSQRYLRGRIYFLSSFTQCFLWMAFLCYPSNGSFEILPATCSDTFLTNTHTIKRRQRIVKLVKRVKRLRRQSDRIQRMVGKMVAYHHWNSSTWPYWPGPTRLVQYFFIVTSTWIYLVEKWNYLLSFYCRKYNLNYLWNSYL